MGVVPDFLRPRRNKIAFGLVTLVFAGSLGLERYDASRALDKVKTEANARAVQIAAAKVAAVAAASAATDLTQCKSGNEFRVKDLDTWQRVFALLNNPSPRVVAVLDRIKEKDKLRDCAAQAKGNP